MEYANKKRDGNGTGLFDFVVRSEGSDESYRGAKHSRERGICRLVACYPPQDLLPHL